MARVPFCQDDPLEPATGHVEREAPCRVNYRRQLEPHLERLGHERQTARGVRAKAARAKRDRGSDSPPGEEIAALG